MFCNRCGKKIESGTLCSECIAIEAMGEGANAKANSVSSFHLSTEAQAIRQEYYSQTEEPGKGVMAGFGLGLSAAILGFVGIIFTYVSFLLCAISETGEAGLVLSFLSLPLCILPFVFGLKSIGRFRRTQAPDRKPIPGFVCGIVGLSESVFAMLFAFLTFVVSLAML